MSLPFSFCSTLSAFTTCFHFLSSLQKGHLCYKSVSHFCLLSPFAHISFLNQFAARSADQTHFVAKAFLEPRELWGHGAWAETRQLFLFLHGWLQLKLNRKPYQGCIRSASLYMPGHVHYRLVHSGNCSCYWGKKKPTCFFSGFPSSFLYI